MPVGSPRNLFSSNHSRGGKKDELKLNQNASSERKEGGRNYIAYHPPEGEGPYLPSRRVHAPMTDKKRKNGREK